MSILDQSSVNKKNITVLICALNEERNIGNLLQDIIDQCFTKTFLENFVIDSIVVVSDGSTDNTVSVVEDFQKKFSKIELIVNSKRIGKIYSLDKVFKQINTDFVILFDADIRLKNDTISKLAEPLEKNKYDLVGGNPIPFGVKKIFNFAEQASFFSWLILQEIKTAYPLSIYSAHGRVLMASKTLYKSLDIGGLSTPGDDQFMYLKSNHNFYYAKDSVVFYYMPNSTEDYVKQNVRFRKAKMTRSKSSFGERYIKNEFKINNKFKILLKKSLSNPYKAFLWSLLYVYGYIKFKIQIQNSTDINKIWQEVKSTK